MYSPSLPLDMKTRVSRSLATKSHDTKKRGKIIMFGFRLFCRHQHDKKKRKQAKNTVYISVIHWMYFAMHDFSYGIRKLGSYD